MTIRLLSTYKQYSPQMIVTLDAAIEALLVAGQNASLDLTGGTVYFEKVEPSSLVPVQKLGGKVSLKANQQATIPVHEGQALNIAGAAGTVGVAYLLDPALGGTNSSKTWPIGTGALAQIGPYAGTQRVLITCSVGSVEAVVGNAVLGAVRESAAIDSSPALTVGGNTIKLTNANTGIPVGDSLSRNTWATTAGATLTRSGGVTTMTGAATGMMDGMNAWMEQFANTSFNRFVGPITRISSSSFSYADPGPDAVTSGGFIANPYRLSDNGWFTWLRAILGNRIVMPGMGARGGDRTDQIYVRMDADVMAYQPSFITVMAGINDIVQNVTGDASGTPVAATAALIFANITKIYDKARAAGITVYACTTLPIEYGYGGLSNATIDGYNAKVMSLNGLIRAECVKGGMILCPTYEAIVDPLSSKSQPLAGMMSADHIHISAKGAKVVAEVAAAPMGAQLPARHGLVASAYDNRNSAGATCANVFTYLPSTATGGTVSGTNASGTCPTGTNVASQGSPASVVASGPARTVAADGDAIGYNVQAVLTAGAANDGVTISGAGGWAGNVVAGNAYYLELALSVTGVAGSNLSKLFAEINFTIAGTTYSLRVLDQTGTTFPTTDMVNYVLQTVPFYLQATPSNTSFDIQAICSAAGTAVTIKASRFTVHEIVAGNTLTF